MIFLIAEYVRLAIADRIVAKKLKVSELSQIARIEKKLYQFLVLSWNKRAKEATKLSVKLAKQLKKPAEISQKINSVMDKWSSDIASLFTTEMENVFILGRNVGFKKATRQINNSLRYGIPQKVKIVEKAFFAEVVPSFSLADQEAINALKNHQLFWIDDFYKRGVSESIADTTREVMAEAGGGSSAAGKLMNKRITETFKHVKIPKGFVGTPKQYFDALTANAMTVSRVHGQMRSFMEIGITRYTISNPTDRRTCPRCGWMDGKTFTIQQGAEQMSSELAATTKQQVKDVHPWPSLGQIKALSSSSGHVGGAKGMKESQALSEAGLSLPTYHFKCRCTVDVATESMTYDSLIPFTLPTPKRPARIIEKVPSGKKTISQDKIAQKLRTSVPVDVKRIMREEEILNLVKLKVRDNSLVLATWKAAKQESKKIGFNVDKGTQHNRESAYYRVDRELEGSLVVPPTISRDPGLGQGIGSLQYYEKTKKIKDSKKFSERFFENKKFDLEPYRRIYLLDLISANANRNSKSILFKSLKENKTDIFAVKNNFSFPKSYSKKYKLPINFAHKNLVELSKDLLTRLKKIKLSRMAIILSEENVDEKSIFNTLLRIKALQKKYKKLKSEFVLDPENKITKFLKDIEANPKKYVSGRDINEIKNVIKTIRK